MEVSIDMRSEANQVKITRVGIDLGKSAFHVHAVGRDGKVVIEKRFTRRALVRFLGEVEPCLVGLEACGGAHHWARVLRDLGHDARLMSPQFVKPYVKSNKNDVNDADGIAEASARPTMRFVGVKSVAQQHIQQLHRARQMAVRNRTAQSNQIRGFLLEYGIACPKGIALLLRRVPEVLEDAENELPVQGRVLLAELSDELRRLNRRVKEFDVQLGAVAKETPAC